MSDNFDARYRAQVRLLLEVLPIVITSPKFALKGGTAINLFVQDMPRLSVDIDLTYLPVTNRNDSIADINALLEDAAISIEKTIRGCVVRPTKSYRSGQELKLLVEFQNSIVKVEPNYILRGCVFPPQIRRLSGQCSKQFGVSMDINAVSFEDLYAGKICAALDRQHPRDLFDIHFLLQNFGISQNLRRAFLVYLMSHNRPMNEILNPNWQDLSKIYKLEFEGMSIIPLSLQQLYDAGKTLQKELLQSLTQDERQFLIAFKKGNADWNAFFKLDAQHLPAILWKQKNLDKLSFEKRKKAVTKLEGVLFVARD